MLTTKRLRLRKLRASDVRAMRTAIGEFDTERYLRGIKSDGDKLHADKMAVAVTRLDFDECIGLVGYHHLERADSRLEIGYALAPSYRGRGLMTEAVRAFVKYCFKGLSIHRVDALIDPENIPSINLAVRIGFRLEGGPLRDYMRSGAGFTNLMVYGLLESDLAE
jgi:ribosomal-protein-alanine N-acetyltransferase